MNTEQGRNEVHRGRAKKKKNRVRKIAGLVAIFLVVVSVAILFAMGLSQLFRTEETRISSPVEVTRTDVLVCEAEAPSGGFFQVPGAAETDHVLKVTYKGNQAEQIFYQYEVDMGSAEAAKAAEAKIHADYNLYMGEDKDVLSNQFLLLGDELKVTLLGAVEDIGSASAKLFFLTPDELETAMGGQNVQSLAQIWQEKGFSCEMDDD